MKLLAVDASGSLGMAAVVEQRSDGVRRVISMCFADSASSHSERLFQSIDKVLADSDCAVSGLSRIVYTSGPGSFTGLRIAYSAVKGLAFGAGIDILGVSTLKSILRNLVGVKGHKCAIIADARDEVFACIVDGNGDSVMDECSIRIDDLILKLSSIEPDVYCVGSGAILYASRLSTAAVVPSGDLFHIISPLGMLNEADTGSTSELNYIKKSYAESALSKKI